VVSKSVPVVEGKTERETAERIAKLAVSPEMSSQRVVAASERNKGLDEHLDIPSADGRPEGRIRASERG